MSRYGAARLRYSTTATYDIEHERCDTSDSARDTVRSARSRELGRDTVFVS